MKDKSRDDDIDPSGLIYDMAEELGYEDGSEDEDRTCPRQHTKLSSKGESFQLVFSSKCEEAFSPRLSDHGDRRDGGENGRRGSSPLLRARWRGQVRFEEPTQTDSPHWSSAQRVSSSEDHGGRLQGV